LWLPVIDSFFKFQLAKESLGTCRCGLVIEYSSNTGRSWVPPPTLQRKKKSHVVGVMLQVLNTQPQGHMRGL
jgi:hypothetical protein